MVGQIELATLTVGIIVAGWIGFGLLGTAGRRNRWRAWEQWRDLHNEWQDRRGQYKGR